MEELENLLLRTIEARAWRRTGQLAADLVRSDSRDRELTLAELEFQRFLADVCLDCLCFRC